VARSADHTHDWEVNARSDTSAETMLTQIDIGFAAHALNVSVGPPGLAQWSVHGLHGLHVLHTIRAQSHTRPLRNHPLMLATRSTS
jgi:hypothetical protein